MDRIIYSSLEPENADNSMKWEEDSGIEILDDSVGESEASTVEPNLLSEDDFSQPSTFEYAGQKRKSLFSCPLPSKISRNIRNPTQEQEHLSVNKTLFEYSEVASGLSTTQPISEIMLTETLISSRETKPNTSAMLVSRGIVCSKKNFSVDSVDNTDATSGQAEPSCYLDCWVKSEMAFQRDMSVVSIYNTGAASGQTEHSSFLDCSGKARVIIHHPIEEGRQPNQEGLLPEAESSSLFAEPLWFQKTKEKFRCGDEWFFNDGSGCYKQTVQHLQSHGIDENLCFLYYFVFQKPEKFLLCKICRTCIFCLPLSSGSDD